MARPPRPFIGLMAGIAAGLVASAAMAAFEAGASKLLEHESDDAPEAPAPSEPEDEQSSQLVRYVAGAVIGGIYGVLTEYRPEASEGFGSTYGVATATLLDDSLGFGADATPDAAPAGGAASHLVFGVVLEGVRWLIAGRR